MDDRALIQGMLAGDAAAFRVAVSEYQGVMRHIARAIIGDAFADEVVQDAWIAIIRALPSFEGRSSLKTWMLQIVGNLAKSRRRREVRNVAVGHIAELETTMSGQDFLPDGHRSTPVSAWRQHSPEQLLESEQLAAVIYQTIDDLPEMQRAVLTLQDMEGVEFGETCKILDVTESNCRVLLHRARLRVWQAIEKFQRGEAS